MPKVSSSLLRFILHPDPPTQHCNDNTATTVAAAAVSAGLPNLLGKFHCQIFKDFKFPCRILWVSFIVKSSNISPFSAKLFWQVSLSNIQKKPQMESQNFDCSLQFYRHGRRGPRRRRRRRRQLLIDGL